MRWALFLKTTVPWICPESHFVSYFFVWGLTSVHIKKKKDYTSNLSAEEWNKIFEDRNEVLSYFQKEPEAFLIEDIRNDE